MIVLVIVAQGSALLAVARSGDGPNHVLGLLLVSTLGTSVVMRWLYVRLKDIHGALLETEEQMALVARTDRLTGLGNRMFVLDEIKRQACLDPDVEIAALLLIDLKNFSRVNDLRGYAAGDVMIREMGSRLRRLLPNASIARLGADEFAIVARLPRASLLPSLCKNLTLTLGRPYDVAGQVRQMRACVGAAVIQGQADTGEFLRRADIARKEAKTASDPYRIFERPMLRPIERLSALETRLVGTLTGGGGLNTLFQPVVTADGVVVGLEALLRWGHSDDVPIAAREAVDIAQGSGFGQDLAFLVADKVCDASAMHPNLTVAMNLTADQVLGDDFVGRLTQRVRSRGVEPEQIQLEITENDFVQLPDRLASVLTALRKRGFQLAADDFGTSNASLAYLKRARISGVKFDRLMLLEARKMGAIDLMSARVRFAKALGLTVTCEGVSDDEEMEIALQVGCDLLQGYYLYRPMDLDDVAAAIRGGRNT